MIIIEFIVFVASSGLFFSDRFRHNITAVIIAGALATGSSFLFLYHIGRMATGTAVAAPPVRIVKQVVKVPVVQKISQPPALSQPEDCNESYPFWARIFDQEGTTGLAFNVLTDGTVGNVTVALSSGSKRLDRAAMDCVKRWHFRPAIKDGKLAEAPWTAQVAWSLGDKPQPAKDSSPEAAAKAASTAAPAESQ